MSSTTATTSSQLTLEHAEVLRRVANALLDCWHDGDAMEYGKLTDSVILLRRVLLATGHERLLNELQEPEERSLAQAISRTMREAGREDDDHLSCM